MVELANPAWRQRWTELADDVEREAFMQDVVTGMSKPEEWGQSTMDAMTFALHMYVTGYRRAKITKP